MIVKKKIEQSDIFIYIMSFIYVIGFYIIFDIHGRGLFESLVHVSFSSYAINYYFRKLSCSINENRFSMASMTLMTFVVYFHLSSIKYAVYQLYPNYISDLNIRLLGSLLVFVTFIISTFVWYYINQKRLQKKILLLKYKKHPLLAWVISILCVIGQSYINTLPEVLLQKAIVTQAKEIIYCIGLVVSILNIKEQDSHKKIILNRSYLPLMVIIIYFVIEALSTGSRGALITPVVIVLAGFLKLKKIHNISVVKRIVGISPILILLYSILIFGTSNRFENDMDNYVKNLVYRFDLSDMAMTEALRTEPDDYSTKSISEAIELAIPSFLFHGDKSAIKRNNQYKKILKKSHLYTEADYNDTLFSMGTEIGNFIGFIIIPIVFIIYFELLDYWICGWKNTDYTIIAIVPYFCGIENSWQKFFFDTRTYLIILICTYFFLRIYFMIKAGNAK